MISAVQVKELREKTGAGMMDCKKALTENNGDFEKAVDWLRTKGLSAAAKKAGRVTSEGLVSIFIKDNFASIIEVNSETDFVAKNDQFQNLVKEISILSFGINDLESLEIKKNESGKTVKEMTTEAIANIGENLTLRRMDSITLSKGVIGSYIHNEVSSNMGRIGVLVALESNADHTSLNELAKQLSMHIAATKPLGLTISDIDSDTMEREKAIAQEQASSSGKPQNVIEKMVEGRIRKFYEEIVLMEQIFVIDGKTKIKDLLEIESKSLGSPVSISKFIRFEVGEGIEVEKSDFAAEVASMIS
jgi:elongation factor Ts